MMFETNRTLGREESDDIDDIPKSEERTYENCRNPVSETKNQHYI